MEATTLMGMPVHVSPYLPKRPRIQLSDDFIWCSDEFRVKQNQWLIDMFGEDDQIIVVGGKMIITPKIHSALIKVTIHP